jgi:hypothetical protein
VFLRAQQRRSGYTGNQHSHMKPAYSTR